jgi:hypothetical protein
MNERLKELAVQAGIYYRTTSDEFCKADKDGVPLEMMERFADLVRADERELCAKLCEEVGDKAKDNDGYTIGGYACAKAIRARGNDEQD